MKASRLPWLKTETGPSRWLPTTERSRPAALTGHVPTSVKPWDAVQRIG